MIDIRLTPRQKEILNGLAQGKTPKQIALELGLKTAGIYNNLNLILMRLGLKPKEYHKIKDIYVNATKTNNI
jgi:DNA-binding CsgD family transcriptional regulator